MLPARCSLPIPFCLSLTPSRNGGNGFIFSRAPHHTFFPALNSNPTFPASGSIPCFLARAYGKLAHVFAIWLVRSCGFIAIVLFDVLVSTFQICLNTPYCLHFLSENKEGKTPMDIAKGTGHAEAIELVSRRGFVLASGHKL